MDKVYDRYQLEAIGLSGGHHLVLAPPGCGKTDILAERIAQAHTRGVDYARMLCLTFTNRAAKGMVERIEERTSNPVPQQLFVGNVHRYCSQLLFENGVVPQGSAIIDEVDMDNIIRDELLRSPDIRVAPMDIFKLQHTMQGIALGHPTEAVLHNYLLREPALRRLCADAGMPFCDRSIAYIYTHIDTVAHMASSHSVVSYARRIEVARRYQLYKEENDIVDFDDLLMLAYDYAVKNPDALRRYDWIQVDEVQDLNTLQLTIIDLLATPDATVVYLGDEQQAIYSFIGAKIETLKRLREACGNNIHYLYHNYRSPLYLLDLLNDYATQQLGIRPDLLPTTANKSQRAPEDLCLLDVGDAALEPYYIARFARRYAELGQGRIAILVPTNKAADSVAETLSGQGIDLFKISGTDLFSTPQVRLLLAHLTVLADESVFIAWARLLHLVGAIPSYSKARNFMRLLKRHAIAPTDMLQAEWSATGTYLARFCRAYSEQDLVVFDTETTGLDIYNDDIIQIAAIKVRQGRVLPGSRFNIIIETQRPIPEEVGGAPNPMLELYAKSRRYSRTEGLELFARYCSGHTLVGHNVEYDYQILLHNLQRCCPQIELPQLCPERIDTLKLIRLLQPRFKHYKLGYLLDKLHLEGANSHRADDDIEATLELMRYCYRQALQTLPAQEIFVADAATARVAARFGSRYAHHYRHSEAQLHIPPDPSQKLPAIAHELDITYRNMIEEGLVEPVDKWQHLLDYITLDLVDPHAYPTLATQLARYVTDLNTSKEADLCGGSLTERFFVSTVHKAKGLEFETVIVADAIDGTYPYARNWTEQQLQEDARRLYVALSRAKRRLCVVYSDYAGSSPHQLTPFLRKVVKHFSHYRRDPETGRIYLSDSTIQS
ncbi:MAG: UvrD-helicase domain-containing protein [Bacteroidales bacterium]|nr:UvrD-helicase domain-containing protein [Bacteroidales bacterium]